MQLAANTFSKHFEGHPDNGVANGYLLALGLMLQALGLLFLAGTTDFWWAALFIAFFGPGYGEVITLRLTLQTQYFGRKAVGAIKGSLMAIMIIGTITSPLLTGRYYAYMAITV
jgi:hypothetical protein